jgi:hypothetical protein
MLIFNQAMEGLDKDVYPGSSTSFFIESGRWEYPKVQFAFNLNYIKKGVKKQ